MTFNSVRIACNQTSSRELVVGEDDNWWLGRYGR